MQEQIQTPLERNTVVIDNASKAENAIRELLEKVAIATGSTDIVREPAADVIEEPNRVIILFDVPGVAKERIKIVVGSNYVEIRADSMPLPQAKFIHLERIGNYRLQRRIEFSFKLKIDEAKAYLKDGILQIIVPKLGENASETELVVE
ncbi:MAG: Hsp20/alpha crystallin family protein [Sulfolobaceae archaeon]|jgi:HSP20 family protein